MMKRRAFLKTARWLYTLLYITLFIALLYPASLASSHIPGDVDGNGTVDIEDARLVARYVVNQIDTLLYPENADATQDTKITIEDALAIAQQVTGRSRIVCANAEHGISGNNYIGAIVRVEVFERFFPHQISGGTVRIVSKSTGYDSGIQTLHFERDGRSLYYLWDTSGLLPAYDYEIYVSLTESGSSKVSNVLKTSIISESMQPDAVLHLAPTTYEVFQVAQSVDAHASAPGISLELRRVFPQDHARTPYLGPFGRGWVHNFDIHLKEYTDGTIAFFGQNGFNRWFKSNHDGTYTASPGDYGLLTRDPDGTFQLKEKNGFIYRFRSDLLFDYMQDTNGNRISGIYNSDKQLIEVAHSCGQSFRFEYNQHGRISKLIDHIGRETTYQYNTDGYHLIRVIAPGNRITSYTYSLGNGEAIDHRLLSIGLPDGTHYYYTYDSKGRITSQYGEWEAGRISYSYDEDGTMHITDTSGGTISIVCNENRQPIKITDQLGNVTRYEYDSNFNLIRITSPLNHTYEFTYDSNGNVTQIKDPLNGCIRLEYEPEFNKVKSFRDSRGITTTFSYDSRGNPVRINYPDTLSEWFTYDAHGLMISKTDRKGQTINYSYNSRGLLISKEYPDGSSANYTYDAAGNCISATNYTGTIGFQYDNMDRLVQVIYPGTRKFQYEYDSAGKRTRMIDPDGKQINYEYDPSGRLVRLSDGSGKTIVKYHYNAENRILRKELGNGAYTLYAYDLAGRTIGVINYSPSGDVISHFYYTYDEAGNCLSKETIEGIERYKYDELNRLTEVIYTDGTKSQFVYDLMGNRLTVKQNGVSTSYSVNNLNQYETVGTTNYKYDGNGNLISKTENGQTTHYEYDFENCLVKVISPTETIDYTYDPFGLRNSQTASGKTINYLWDGYQVAIEEDVDNNTIASYEWGVVLDEALRMERNGNYYYYTQDVLLSVSDLLDASGNPVEHYQYQVFGQPLVESQQGNPWLFTGLAYDFRTGLQYNRFRYYSPDIGRFISPDPISFLGGVNLYLYANNNPTNFVDPFGYRRTFQGYVQAFVTGAIAGGIVGAVRTIPTLLAGFGAAGNITLATGVFISSGIPVTVTITVPAVLLTYISAVAAEALWGGIAGVTAYRMFDKMFDGGGVCPTFIQLPPNIEASALSKTVIDISHEKLACKITVPISDALVRSDIPIFGVADGKNFKEYRVEYGAGRDPKEWHLIESSTIPQLRTTVGPAEMRLMQGDIDIRGNLATWNTGLKNWSHLPWHPPEDPTDLNGIYTLRLVVIGRDGQTVEDRVTVEVGRVIAQCLSGIAISPDKRVIMRFPEQSIAYPFRIYTILPVDEICDELPPIVPEGTELIGDIYRIREPGDRFIKDVSLEFSVNNDELQGRIPEHIGILKYDASDKRWVWLDTLSSVRPGVSIFSTTLTELPKPKAIYALAYDPFKAHLSQSRTREKPELATLNPISPGILVHDTFDEDMGRWKSRDRFVGATLTRDNKITSDSSYVLRVTNESYGGNFSVTVIDQPFDVREYPLMTFDYRISPGVKTDFYLLVNGRWYNLGFTDDPINFRNKDVNIANLGRIQNVIADDQWHSVSVDLYKLLRQKTRYTRVDTIMMADWDVGGYMKLEFGHNARGATYYIDNFKLSVGPYSIKVPDGIAVDTFDTAEPSNLLGGPSGTFSNPGTNFCQAIVTNDATKSNGNRVLKLSFDTSQINSYCGYWTALMAADMNEMSELSLRLHVSDNIPKMLLGLRHAVRGEEAKVPLLPYLSSTCEDGWMTATIPLTAFSGRGLPDLSLMDTLFVTFDNSISSGKGIVFLDDIQFRNKSTFGVVADFDRYPMEYNLLGGGFRTKETGAAAISAGYHEDKMGSDSSKVGTVRISYGGTIGLDYGEGKFSYAIWETDLLGFDARGYKELVFKIRGEHGGEKPNFYLDDGTVRRAVQAKDLPPITRSWQEMRIPLEKFSSQGVDLSHLEGIQLDFEWENMSGTIYISEIRFGGSAP